MKTNSQSKKMSDLVSYNLRAFNLKCIWEIRLAA